jgi:hypothetical protein
MVWLIFMIWMVAVYCEAVNVFASASQVQGPGLCRQWPVVFKWACEIFGPNNHNLLCERLFSPKQLEAILFESTCVATEK